MRAGMGKSCVFVAGQDAFDDFFPRHRSEEGSFLADEGNDLLTCIDLEQFSFMTLSRDYGKFHRSILLLDHRNGRTAFRRLAGPRAGWI